MSVARLHGQLLNSEWGVSEVADMKSVVVTAIDCTVEALCLVKRQGRDRVECSFVIKVRSSAS